jgi:uncharacterized membrane protein YfcA
MAPGGEPGQGWGMLDSPLPSLPLLIGVFLLAGLAKGLTGMGLPAIGIALLSLMIPPAQAAALVVVPSLATNVWQALDGPALRPLARRLWPMLAALVLGTWGSATLIGGPGAAWGGAALGTALVAYAALGLSPLRLPLASPRAEPWLGPAAGAATGLVTAATGVFVLPSVPYLQALGLQKDGLVQALGLTFTVATLALAWALAGAGMLGGGALGGSFLALAATIPGLVAGQRLRRALRPEPFRLCFLAALGLLGAHLVLRGLLD